MYLHRALVIAFTITLGIISPNLQSATITYHLTGTLFSADQVFSSINSNDQWAAWFSIDSGATDPSPDPLLGKYIGIIGEIEINNSVVAIVASSSFTSSAR